MGIDFNIKPVGAPVAAPIVRPLPEVAKGAVRTELPAPKTATSADASIGVRSQKKQAPNISRQVAFDRDAGEIVYRVVDERTSEVVRQFPDEGRLRLRAYLRTLDEAKRDAAPVKDDAQPATVDQSA